MYEISLRDRNGLAKCLRQLHSVLLRCARSDYIRENELKAEPAPGELLMLVTQNESFAWLRSLSELMAQIDELADDPDSALNTLLQASVRGAVEHLLTPAPGDSSTFAAKYARHLHDDPEVTMAHAAVKQLLLAWPKPLAEVDPLQSFIRGK